MHLVGQRRFCKYLKEFKVIIGYYFHEPVQLFALLLCCTDTQLDVTVAIC